MQGLDDKACGFFPKTTNSFFELELVFRSHNLIEKKLVLGKDFNLVAFGSFYHVCTPHLVLPKKNTIPLHHHFYKFSSNS
jgi:hypothetical protein